MHWKEPLTPQEEEQLREAEEYLEHLNRRFFDRRKINRQKQITWIIGVALGCIAIGTFLGTVGSKAGWSLFGPSDEIRRIDTRLIKVEQDVDTLKRQRITDGEKIDILIGLSCAKAGEIESAILVFNSVNCARFLPPTMYEAIRRDRKNGVHK